MTSDTDFADSFEPCRTCGVFFLTGSGFLRRIFPVEESDMMLALIELASWNVEISENDGLPQRICTNCLHILKNFFKFRRNCIDVQSQFLNNNIVEPEHQIKIKTEKIDPDENMCDIIYVDDLSDGEYENITPFNFAHIPIKQEPIEAAPIPYEPLATSAESGISRNFCPDDTPVLDSLNVGHHSENENDMNCFSQQPATQENTTDFEFATKIENKSSFVEHNNKVKNFVCPSCGKEFINFTAQRIRFHLKWHELGKKYPCAHWKFSYNSKKGLKIHSRMHRRIECKICKNHVLAKKMKEHLRNHNLESEWKCLSDNEDSSTVSPLQSTEEPMEQIDEAYLIVCSKCDHKFQNTSDLMVHVLEHHTVKSDSQRISGSNSSSQRYDHQTEGMCDIFEREHNNIYSNLSSCAENAFDGNASDSSDGFGYENENMSPVNENRLNQFLCANCTQSFSSIEALREHNKDHIKKNFKCHICGKMFELKFSLNRHIQKHKIEECH